MLKEVYTPLKLMITGAAMAAALAIAGLTLALAQGEAEGEAEAEGIATASPEEICEAIQRSQARTKKFLEEGVPEEFGSEEPFTFDPSKC